MNETHGVIRAIVDFSVEKPKPTVVTGYEARTSDSLRFVKKGFSDNRAVDLLRRLDATFDRQSWIPLRVILSVIPSHGPTRRSN